MSTEAQQTPIAQQTTTLPEGATVSVARIGAKRTYTEIRAWREGAIVKMRGDSIPPQNLPAYLTLTVNEINRRRALLVVKPPDPIAPVGPPKDMNEFVIAMARADMFIFNVMTPEKAVEALGLELTEPRTTRPIEYTPSLEPPPPKNQPELEAPGKPPKKKRSRAGKIGDEMRGKLDPPKKDNHPF